MSFDADKRVIFDGFLEAVRLLSSVGKLLLRLDPDKQEPIKTPAHATPALLEAAEAAVQALPHPPLFLPPYEAQVIEALRAAVQAERGREGKHGS